MATGSLLQRSVRPIHVVSHPRRAGYLIDGFAPIVVLYSGVETTVRTVVERRAQCRSYLDPIVSIQPRTSYLCG